MAIKRYYKRIADTLLARKLESTGAVLIEGPKWCGKTTTALQQAKSVLYMADPDRLSENMQLYDLKPSVLLQGNNPRLIDEWQIAPKLWDAVRFEVDKRGEMGQFILTGSAVPADNKDIHHAGTGRFSWLTMRPMTLFESGESTGAVSLGTLFSEGGDVYAENTLDLDDIAYLVCRGGWPLASIMKNKAVDFVQATDYYDAVVKSDIARVDGSLRNEQRTKRIMRSYARHQGAQVPLTTIRKDLLNNETESLTEETIASYINALKKNICYRRC